MIIQSLTGTYAERLAAFIAREPGRYQSLDVWWIRLDGSVCSTGVRLEKDSSHAECECCGTRRLKWLWPVQDSGGRILWIGEDCRTNLDRAKKLACCQFQHVEVEE